MLLFLLICFYFSNQPRKHFGNRFNRRQPLKRFDPRTYIAPHPQKKQKVEHNHIIGSHAFLIPPMASLRLPLVSQPPRPAPFQNKSVWNSTPSPLPPSNTMPFRPSLPIINKELPVVMTPQPAIKSPSVITNESPKIGADMNNRIFVDGRAYEVWFFKYIYYLQ